VIGTRRTIASSGDAALGGEFTARALDRIAAGTAVAAMAVPAIERGAFVRDPAWFAWRFLDPAVAPAYRFARITHARHREMVVAIAQHSYRGLSFSVLADALPALSDQTLPVAVRSAATFGASPLVYFTTNLPAIGNGLTALGTRIPTRLDPRPVQLLALPGGSIDVRELATSTIQTADWMAF
jgi:hypothetical protein